LPEYDLHPRSYRMLEIDLVRTDTASLFLSIHRLSRGFPHWSKAAVLAHSRLSCIPPTIGLFLFRLFPGQVNTRIAEDLLLAAFREHFDLMKCNRVHGFIWSTSEYERELDRLKIKVAQGAKLMTPRVPTQSDGWATAVTPTEP
jgi:hypothetical protein